MNSSGGWENEGRRRLEEILRPGGRLIGEPGANRDIREMPGGFEEAVELFEELAAVGQVIESAYAGSTVRIGDEGYVSGVRQDALGNPTIDVNIRGIGIRKIKFKK